MDSAYEEFYGLGGEYGLDRDMPLYERDKSYGGKRCGDCTKTLKGTRYNQHHH